MPPEAIPPAWRAPLGRLAAVWLALIAAFWADWRAIAGQWWNSSTYNHILLIPPILAWLVAVRWLWLSFLKPQAWWPGAVLFALALLVWVLGSMAEAAQLREIGAVLLLPVSALALLGPRIGAGLAFPLAYMVFLIPMGDELIPLLQTVTARIAMALLALSHIPARLSGVFIATPGGYFEVAEACSGIKFLIAMIAYGALAANVCFRAWPRRAAFLLACVVVPVLANGVRAWGTIAIAQTRGVAFAAGFDHIVYGWVFFALVMALVMALAWRFFDRAVDDPLLDPVALAGSLRLARWARWRAAPGPLLATLAAGVAIALGWTGFAAALAAPLPARIDLPAVPGWQRVASAPRYPWAPRHGGADHRLRARYADGAGHVVDVSFALYARQGAGHKAEGAGEGAVPPASGWAWLGAGAALGGGHAEWIEAPGPTDRLALTWYRHGGVLTGSRARLKLATLSDRLALRAAPTATLILSSEDVPGHPAQSSLAAFLAAIGPVDRWMDRVSMNG